MSKTDTKVIKGIAILAMIFYHLYYSMDIGELSLHTGLIWSGDGTQVIAKACHICVPLFVFATGYGLASIEKNRQSCLRDSYRGALRRYVRMVWDQAYILIVLLFVIYMTGLGHTAEEVWGGSAATQIAGVITNVFGVADLFHLNWFCEAWWYLGLAVLWIFLVPVLYRIAEKIGPIASAVLCLLLPFALGLNTYYDTIGRYFAILMFGILWVTSDLDRRILDFCRKRKAYSVGVSIVLVLCIPILLLVKYRVDAAYLIETAQALMIVVLSRIWFDRLRVVKNVLAFFGEHSKYMWLLHVFFYSYWFRGALSGIRNIWLIYGIVVGLSLSAALLLRAAKQWVACRGRLTDETAS